MTTDTTPLTPIDAELMDLGHECELDAIEFGRAVLARWGTPAPVGVEPAKRQYYYKVDGCPARNSESPDCICWHDDGTGPRATADPTLVSWRGADQVLATGRVPLTHAQRTAAFIRAEKKMQSDVNLSWRHALADEIEAAHGIKGGQHGTE